MRHSARRLQSGFTLLELLIALAITAAVVTLMFAGFALIGAAMVPTR